MNTNDYTGLLYGIKARVRAARLRAAAAVNSELVLLYWHIGRDILKRQSEQGWGAKVVDRLSRDLKQEFPNIRGFSPRNLKYMQSFAAKWPQEPIVQGVLAQLSSRVQLRSATLDGQGVRYDEARCQDPTST